MTTILCIAISAVRAVTSSTDFQMEMLQWSAKQAQQCDLNEVLEYCLRTMLEITKATHVPNKGIEALTLVRWEIDQIRCHASEGAYIHA